MQARNMSKSQFQKIVDLLPDHVFEQQRSALLTSLHVPLSADIETPEGYAVNITKQLSEDLKASILVKLKNIKHMLNSNCSRDAISGNCLLNKIFWQSAVVF